MKHLPSENILQKLEENHLFSLRYTALETGDKYSPLTDRTFEKKILEQNAHFIEMTEECDGYYSVHLSADDLAELGKAMVNLSKELRAIEKQDRKLRYKLGGAHNG